MKNNIHLTKCSNQNILALLTPLFLIWFALSAYLIFDKWDAIYHLAFNDADDLMRHHQYTQWIQNGNWYLQPLQQLNPEDGQIMHWTRVTDIPLAVMAYIAHSFTDWQTAFTFANVVVPLLYLFIFGLSMASLAYRLFGLEEAQITILVTFMSPIIIRFMPGAIDHHNLQFILLTLFILFFPLTDFNKLKQKAFLPSLAMVISLWIGLENIYSFVITLFVTTLWGVLHDRLYLKFCQHFCLYSSVLILIAIILNRPINELFTTHYDAISFPFFICFIGAFLFCYILNLKVGSNKKTNIINYILIGAVFFSPILLLYPEFIKGGYADYPTILKEKWLNNISEVISLSEYIKSDIAQLANIIVIAPALISIFFFEKKKLPCLILYFTFMINLLLGVIWQIRMYNTALIYAIPLTAYTCAVFRQKSGLAISKLVILMLCLPVLSLYVSHSILSLFKENNQNHFMMVAEENDNPYNNRALSVSNLLKKHQIEHKKLLTSIYIGAFIIPTSNNSVLAAPYHRNIRGNTETLSFFLENDSEKAKEILIRNNIDYVLIDHFFWDDIDNENDPLLMVNKLYQQHDVPSYLELIDSKSTIKLYKFNQ